MIADNVGHGGPLGLAVDPVEALVSGIGERKETIGTLLDWQRRGQRERRRHQKQREHPDERERWVMHASKVICPHHIVKRSFSVARALRKG